MYSYVPGRLRICLNIEQIFVNRCKAIMFQAYSIIGKLAEPFVYFSLKKKLKLSALFGGTAFWRACILEIIFCNLCCR